MVRCAPSVALRSLAAGTAEGSPAGRTHHAGTNCRARRPWRKCLTHHTSRNRPAPAESTMPTPDAAVDRTVKWVWLIVSPSAGDWIETFSGNAPDVRASTPSGTMVAFRVSGGISG